MLARGGACCCIEGAGDVAAPLSMRRFKIEITEADLRQVVKISVSETRKKSSISADRDKPQNPRRTVRFRQKGADSLPKLVV